MRHKKPKNGGRRSIPSFSPDWTGNLTGINLFAAELQAKRLELLHELVPRASRIAVLVNPADVTNTEATLRDVGAAARAIGLQIQVLNASTITVTPGSTPSTCFPGKPSTWLKMPVRSHIRARSAWRANHHF